MELESLLTLIRHWADYSAGRVAPDLREFGNWLAQQAPDDPVEWSSEGQQATFDQLNFYRYLPLPDQLGIIMIRLTRLIRLHFKAKAQNEIGFEELTVLFSLYEQHSHRLLDVQRNTMHEPATTSRMVNRMIEKGWIEETPHPTDKRSKILTTTAAGGDVRDRHRETIHQVFVELFSSLTPDVLAHVVEQLAPVHDLQVRRHLGSEPQ